jgi:uncharacterized protein (TIGR02285 family)
VARRLICAVVFAAVLSGIAPLAAWAEDKPRLTWVSTASPPTHIEDRGAGPGIADETLDWFIARLPGFEHEIISADALRLEAMMMERDGVCSPALVKAPERLAYAVFSKPVYWSEPPRLIANAAHATEIDQHANDRGEIELAALLDDGRLSGARLVGRSYSAGIDRTLNAAKPAARIVLLNHANEMDMLANGRFDWTIALPIHIEWWRHRSNPPEGEDAATPAVTTDAAVRFALITRGIAGEPAELVGYMGCSDQAIGRRAIEAINAIIEQAGPNPPWTEFYLKWLDGDSKADWQRRHQRLN